MSGRYSGVPILTRTDADGRRVPYLARRFLGRPVIVSGANAYRVGPGQRIDQIAAVTLGSAELSWLIADANAVSRPSDLERPGAIIAILVSGGLGVRDGI